MLISQVRRISQARTDTLKTIAKELLPCEFLAPHSRGRLVWILEVDGRIDEGMSEVCVEFKDSSGHLVRLDLRWIKEGQKFVLRPMISWSSYIESFDETERGLLFVRDIIDLVKKACSK